jgi:hypothetical protein
MANTLSMMVFFKTLVGSQDPTNFSIQEDMSFSDVLEEYFSVASDGVHTVLYTNITSSDVIIFRTSQPVTVKINGESTGHVVTSFFAWKGYVTSFVIENSGTASSDCYFCCYKKASS